MITNLRRATLLAVVAALFIMSFAGVAMARTVDSGYVKVGTIGTTSLYLRAAAWHNPSDGVDFLGGAKASTTMKYIGIRMRLNRYMLDGTYLDSPKAWSAWQYKYNTTNTSTSGVSAYMKITRFKFKSETAGTFCRDDRNIVTKTQLSPMLVP